MKSSQCQCLKLYLCKITYVSFGIYDFKNFIIKNDEYNNIYVVFLMLHVCWRLVD